MASSITGQTFMLFKNGSTTKIAAKVSYDPSTRTAKLNPTNNLQRGVTYRAVLTTGAKDVAGISPRTAKRVVVHGEKVERTENCCGVPHRKGGSPSVRGSRPFSSYPHSPK